MFSSGRIVQHRSTQEVNFRGKGDQVHFENPDIEECAACEQIRLSLRIS